MRWTALYLGVLFLPSSAFSVCNVLNSAKFTEPRPGHYFDIQSKLRNEVQAAISQFNKTRTSYADMMFDKILSNTIAKEAVRISELKLARRELFRNAKGRDDQRIQGLKRTLELFIEVVDTWHLQSTKQLRPVFYKNLAELIESCAEFSETKSRTSHRKLAETIGWMKSRGQLSREIQLLEKHFLLPNAIVRIDKGFIDRLVPRDALKTTLVSPVTSTIVAPTGFLGSNQPTLFNGTAHTSGEVSYEIVPNIRTAELKIVFRGSTTTSGVGRSGPVNAYTVSEGALFAESSIFWDGLKFSYSPISSFADIQVKEQNFQSTLRPLFRRAPLNNLIENIARNRARQSNVRSAVKRQADFQARLNLTQQISAQLNNAFAKVGTIQPISDDQFSNILTPIIAEDLMPKVHSSRTSKTGIFINGLSRWRNQLGAGNRCEAVPAGDVSICLHESAIANTISRSWRSKDVDDSFFAGVTAAILNEVPYDLFITETSTRWKVHFSDMQPFEVELNSVDDIRLRMHIKGFQKRENGSSDWLLIERPTAYEAKYGLKTDEYGDLYLARESDVQVFRSTDSQNFDFIDEKMTAFLAPDINFGGLDLPEGGAAGNLNKIRVREFTVADQWLKIGFGIPDEFVEGIKTQVQQVK